MGYLDRYTLLQSRNLDELRDCVAQEVGPHLLELQGRRQEIDARICAARLDELSLFHASYGEVDLRFDGPDCAQDAFLFCLPTSGGGTFHQGRDGATVTPERMLIRDLRRPFLGRQRNFGTFALLVPLARLRRHAQALYGPAAAEADLRFDPTADLGSAQGRHLRNTIHFIAEEMNAAAARGGIAPNLRAAWEELLVGQLLTALPNGLEQLAAGSPLGGALPYHVKRARDYIHDHAGEKVRLADLAAAAGCSLRTLQAAFAETTGLSPSAYLKAVRLERAHAELRAAEPGRSTVAEIAGRWGFGDLGRFARDYRHRFGERPSETLRRLD